MTTARVQTLDAARSGPAPPAREAAGRRRGRAGVGAAGAAPLAGGALRAATPGGPGRARGGEGVGPGASEGRGTVGVVVRERRGPVVGGWGSSGGMVVVLLPAGG